MYIANWLRFLAAVRAWGFFFFLVGCRKQVYEIIYKLKKIQKKKKKKLFF